MKTSFTCPAKNGYYADVDNDCLVFHVCNVIPKDDGSLDVEQHSFICGNQTMFDQLSMTCSFPENAVSCKSAPDFYYLNERLGEEKALFHDDSDIQRAYPLIPRFRQGVLKA